MNDAEYNEAHPPNEGNKVNNETKINNSNTIEVNEVLEYLFTFFNNGENICITIINIYYQFKPNLTVISAILMSISLVQYPKLSFLNAFNAFINF